METEATTSVGSSHCRQACATLSVAVSLLYILSRPVVTVDSFDFSSTKQGDQLPFSGTLRFLVVFVSGPDSGLSVWLPISGSSSLGV